MQLFEMLETKVKAHQPTIVFPEGIDARVLGAAVRLKKDGLVTPIVIGPRGQIEETAAANNIDVADLETIDPASYEGIEELVASFVERRKGKATEEQARALILKDVNTFGTMLVHTGKAEGLVSGAMHATGDTVRPALQIIKMQEGYKKTSGVFIMVRDDEQYVFADCAINIAPDANDLAENAIASAKNGKNIRHRAESCVAQLLDKRFCKITGNRACRSKQHVLQKNVHRNSQSTENYNLIRVLRRPARST